MNVTARLKEFILENNYTQENIDNFLISCNITEKQLIRRCFKLLNSCIPSCRSIHILFMLYIFKIRIKI